MMATILRSAGTVLLASVVGVSGYSCWASCAGRCIHLDPWPWSAYVNGTGSRIDFHSGCIHRAWKDGTEPYVGPYDGCTNGTTMRLYERRSVIISHPCAAYAAQNDLLYTTTAPTGPIIEYGTLACCHPAGTCYTQP